MKLDTNRLIVALACACFSQAALAEGAPLTYQGRLIADGEPVPNGQYTLTIEIFRDSGASARVCGDNQVSVDVVGGYFTHTLEDTGCRGALELHVDKLYVRVIARGGPFGDRDVEIGMHPVSTGVFALHAVSGGGAIGDIVPSMLDPDDFQAMRGPGWVLADGGSYPESRYAELTGRAAVPDLRGVFLRGLDHGRIGEDGQGNPEGNLALGSYQADRIGSHTHEVELGAQSSEDVDPGPVLREERKSEEESHTFTTSPSGGEETRPRNVTVNFFIRID